MLELKQPMIVKLLKKKIKIFGKGNFRYCKIDVYKLIHISLKIGNSKINRITFNMQNFGKGTC